MKEPFSTAQCPWEYFGQLFLKEKDRKVREKELYLKK
jgi:hypothetical protein